jgi:hypothetical protein
MDRNGLLILPLWGLDDGRVHLPHPKRWHSETLLFRVWWDGPGVITFTPREGFVPRNLSQQRPINKKTLQELVYRHVNRETQQSPFVSTSLSLYWAFATAFKIFKANHAAGKAVKISIIRAYDIRSEMIHVALDYLPKSENPHLQKLRKWADHSQEVLIQAGIPACAVIGTYTVDFTLRTTIRADGLCAAKEHPWMTFDDGRISAKDYAERWLDAFSNYKSQGKHAMQCLRFSAQMLGKEMSETHGDAATLANYLYRWPSSRCTRIYRPTLEASFEVISRRRQVALKAEAEVRRPPDSAPDDMDAHVVDESDWDD